MEYEEGELEDDPKSYEAEEGVWNDAGEDTEEIDFNEKWDDTALIEAWDSAVREYQKYHSGKVTHTGNTAKRRRTKKQREPDGGQIVERPDNNEIPSSLESQTQADAGPSRAGLDHVPAPDDETDEQPPPESAHRAYHVSNDSRQHGAWHTDTLPPEHRCTSCHGPRFAALTDDEDLTNMMMAWYYAGYYTSIYNSKRKRES